jgi:hypothetical protein
MKTKETIMEWLKELAAKFSDKGIITAVQCLNICLDLSLLNIGVEGHGTLCY